MFSLRILHRHRPTLERLTEILELKSANTARAYLGALRSLLTFTGFSADELAQVTGDTCIQYLGHLKKKPVAGRVGVSAATMRLQIDALRVIWEILIEMKLCTKNPWGRVGRLSPRRAEQRRPTQLISPLKIKQMIKSVKNSRDRAILCVLFGGALRRSEARALTCADVTTLYNGTVCLHLAQTKNRTSPVVALPNWAGQAVLALLAERREQHARPSDPLFAQTFKHKPARQMSEASLYRVFKRAAARVGMPNAAPHAARASAITKLLADGYSAYEIAEFSRHASLEMLKVYDKRRREVSESLARKLKY